MFNKETITTGSIDYCYDLLVPMLLEEILGTMHDEKEVQEIKNKSVEFKGKHAYDCFYMLGQKINFKGEALLDIFKLVENLLKGDKINSTATGSMLTNTVNRCGE